MEPQITDVAIIGMAGRFPGARDLREFWQNLCNGRECITHFAPGELETSDSTGRADYVMARGIVADADRFDAAFFGIYPKEAELIDPQQRIFLECCWHAFEDAGYDPLTYDGIAAIYAGCSPNTYFLRSLCADRDFIQRYTAGYQVSNLNAMLGGNFEFLPTRVAYKLNLRGPAFSLNSGCSTSLVAVCQAGLALQNYQCDLALAGGVSITFPQKRGYIYEPGGMVSPDGHCRTFDEAAQGTVFGDGAGVVLLKRLSDAIAHRDHIYAVIKGFGVTNDGIAKVGFTAPAIEGQERAITMALESAGVDAESISYIEAHGTATPLGDPIEIKALTRAFRRHTEARQFCAIGSVKTAVGHLDVAAGVAGLIKTALALEHRSLPPSLHFNRPNPALEIESSPFFVNTRSTPWKAPAGVLRAGVSAFGMGGTNAHVILEAASASEPVVEPPGPRLLVLSARSETALAATSAALAEHLKLAEESSTTYLADAAYTLATGRHPFDLRRAVVARTLEEAAIALSAGANEAATRVRARAPDIAFMFPGQGAQYAGMGRELYEAMASFRAAADECLALLDRAFSAELRQLLFGDGPGSTAGAAQIDDTLYAQPALFIVEYALARSWIELGITPAAMIGHSVGEFVAACISGVMTFDEAVRVIAGRAQMMQALPGGAMIAVRLADNRLQQFLNESLDLAAVNAPSLCVVAGPYEAVAELEGRLERERVGYRRLRTSHAFHSSMMEPVVERFAELMSGVQLKPPTIPFLSGSTGDWISPQEATDRYYWARHLRSTVRFSPGIARLRAGAAILLEVGPGRTLTTLAYQHSASDPKQPIVTSMAEAAPGKSEQDALLAALGTLWTHGANVRWETVYRGQKRSRVPLPLYPYERSSFWIAPPASLSAGDQTVDPPLPMIMLTEALDGTRPNQGGADESASGPVAVEQAAAGRDDSICMAVNGMNSRCDQIRASVDAIFHDLSGLDLSSVDDSASFLEMGFDSLFLTQVSQALQSKLGIKITFRQLMDRLCNRPALVAYLDQQLPSTAFPASAPAIEPAKAAHDQTEGAGLPRGDLNDNFAPAMAALASAAEVNSTAGPELEALFKSQLQAMSSLMARQLEVLRASGPGQTAGARPSESTTGAASVPTSITQPPANGPQPRKFIPFGSVKGNPAEPMQPEQLAALQSLIDRYNRKTAGSKRLTADHRARLADPRAAAGFRVEWKELVYPLASVRSQGARLWDVDGNEYIDVVNSYGPIMFGHNPDFVRSAIQEQLKSGFETGPQSVLACKVAELICEMTGMERASFCNTGSEAVVAALRVARTVTARDKIVLFSGAYHGMFDEVVVKAVPGANGPRSLPVAPGIPREQVANVTVLDYGTDSALRYITEHAAELAAVLVEPVQSRHPRLQPIEFLREVRRVTEQSGTALIFDEVVTGFRTHPGGCQALFGIRADVATYGKVLAGGLPIGIVAGRAAFMDALDGGMWHYGDDSYPEAGVTFFAGTFVRHPLALAAAWAVLNHLKASGPRLQEDLNARTAAMTAELNRFLEEHQVPARLDAFSSFAYFSFPPELKFASLFYYHMRLRGIYIQEGFPLFLTTAHGDREIARVIDAFKESILEMQTAGFLPRRAPDLRALPESPSRSGSQPERAAEPNGKLSAGVGEDSLQREPLTESQIEIWLSASVSDEHNCCYNESLSLKLEGDLDRPGLLHALQAVIARHNALRTRFSPDGEYQEFLPELRLDLAELDCSALDERTRSSRLEELIQADASRPFDLINGPLVRATLVKLAPTQHHLLFTTHHLVCDGWSTNVVLDELAEIYNTFVAGGGADLPAAMSFVEYARSQAAHYSGEAGAAAEQYWLEQFKELPPALDLPLDRPRPPVKSCRGATRRRLIGSESYHAIKQAAARQKCTLFVMLLAGFQALLSRLSGQDDIVVGIPSAGQALLDDRILVGHCVNFLPLRGRIAGDRPFADYLGQVRQTLLNAYDHQNYTYGRLVRKLAIQRDPSRLPLLEVQFNLERIGGGKQFAGLTAVVDPNPKSFVNHDLFLNVIETADGLLIDCDYNAILFDASTIDRWLSHYQVMLEAAARDAQQPLAQLPLLSAAERQRLIEIGNGPVVEYRRDLCVHQLVEQQAARTPEAVAAVFEDQQLTYAELDRRTNLLAAYLDKLGIGAGALVGIYLDRSLEMLIATLGVLKAGAAYVPMDPTYPPARILHVLEDSQLALLLSQEALASTLPATLTPMVLLDTAWEKIANENGRPPRQPQLKPRARPNPEDRAYVIYTSGSTGEPKGVEVSHRAVVNLLTAMRQRPGLGANDILLAVTTFCFDIAALELFLPLCVGAKVVIATRADAADGARLLARISSSAATVIQATPVTFWLLLEAGWSGTPGLKILCGGEALPRELANKIVERSGSLWNMYGPTETTIWSSTLQLEAGEGPVLIGPPIANTQFHVVDSYGELVPIGVPGELLIGGDGLAHGYFRRPALTAERFIRNRFSAEPAARLYRTGDRVRRIGERGFEFLGRLDYQVKLRGFRIELGEIETALARYPGVREAVVTMREDTPGDKRLVAYICTEQQALSVTAVREFLTGKLPNYMLPSAVVRIEAMPLTPNGKVDRRALPAPAAGIRRGTVFVAPRSANEQTLAAIWAEVLRLERVGVRDDLFELGADSLHIFQIAARADKAGIHLAPAQFLRHRTIEALLAHADQKDQSVAAPLPGIVRVAREKYRIDRSSF